jgi:hypothetical protein
MPPAFADPDVATAFERHPPALREALLDLRALVFAVTNATPGTGQLVETLKWGQPAYLTEKPKSGTTLRIDADANNGGDYALYVPCTTNLVVDWRERYPGLTFGGTRSVHFRLDAELPVEEISHCIALAMTYHRRKR